MLYEGGYDMAIYDKYEPTLLGAFVNKTTLIGCNSGHQCNDREYRSRGLWVNSDYRGRGIGKMLLLATIEEGEKAGSEFIWSIPRHGSLDVYLSTGFVQTTPWFNQHVEFGPNCYVTYEYGS
jgi:GNAT superfamily N-acetyltransferase